MLEAVETSYKHEGGKIVKDFIKLGLDFVRSHPDTDQSQLNFVKAEKDVTSKVTAKK